MKEKKHLSCFFCPSQPVWMGIANTKIQRSQCFLLRQAVLFQCSLVTISPVKIRMVDSRGPPDSPFHEEWAHRLGGSLECSVNVLVSGPYENEYWHLALNTISSLEKDLESWSVLGGKDKKSGKWKKGTTYLLCMLKAFVYIEIRFMRS